MTEDPVSAGFDPERLNRITDHLNENFIENGKIIGCQTLVARRGQLAYFKSLGLADRERNHPVNEDTIFRIYSMSKPITSVALMQLYEKGLFQLNDPIHRVLKDWRDLRVWVSGESNFETKDPLRPLTFRHLLSHTGGLTYGGGAHPVDKAYSNAGLREEKGETLSSFAQKLGQIPLRYDPGEAWLYSYSTDVCGHLVEVLSGKPFDLYLQEEIFEPLGMVDTGFTVPNSHVSRFAANYGRQPDKSLQLIDDPADSTYLQPKSFFSGGGGLVSTTSDYWRFSEMLRRGGELDGKRILGPRTIELMRRNHLSDNRDLAGLAIGAFSETAYEGIGFGLGFASTLDTVDAGQFGAQDFFWGGAAS
ncbi:MAG: serine hydrolase domain-containing protein, partial [Gammaproteobacteria bacterium]